MSAHISKKAYSVFTVALLSALAMISPTIAVAEGKELERAPFEGQSVPELLLDNHASPEIIQRNTEASGEVSRLAEGEEWYGGQWVDNRASVIHVMVKEGSLNDPHTRAQLARLESSSDKVKLETVKYSKAELKETMSKLLNDERIQKSEFLVQVSPNAVINRVLAKVYKIPDKTKQELLRDYGEILKLEESLTPRDYGEGDGTYAGTRANDTIPVSAGIFIQENNKGCTLGHSILFRGYRYMTTAAHCVTLGAAVTNGGRTIGIANWRSGATMDVDAAIITASGMLSMYTTSSSKMSMTNTPWNLEVGHGNCISGAYTNARCGFVFEVDSCRYTGGRYVCGLDATQSSSIDPLAGQGDSGGPSYIVSPGKRYTGIVMGPVVDYMEYNPCPINPGPSPGRRCSRYIWTTGIVDTLTRFGSTSA